MPLKIAADQLAISYFKSYNLKVNIINHLILMVQTIGKHNSKYYKTNNFKKHIKLGNIYSLRDFTYVKVVMLIIEFLKIKIL